MMISVGACPAFLGQSLGGKPIISRPGFAVSNRFSNSDDTFQARKAVISQAPQRRQLPPLSTIELTTPSTDTTTPAVIDSDYRIKELNRGSFPPDFVFGAASAAYQYEGGVFEVGKGPSIWDTFSSVYPGKVTDRSNGNVANDSYNRYKEDVRIMKEMGCDTYRFSISWSRILPYGKLSRGVNEKGLLYYHNLINECLANGIEPYVTIFHFDLPQYLQDAYGGFFSSQLVDDFRDFADLCFSEYGDKVKHWITFNEPYTYCTLWYDIAMQSSKKCQLYGKCIDGDPAAINYNVAHNLLLAHAAAVDLYRKKYKGYQEGIIGITLNSNWYVPLTKEQADVEATERAMDWMLGWFLDPVTYGEYPVSMQLLVGDRLPKFTEEQSKLLRGSIDFLGVNYYTGAYVKYQPIPPNEVPCFSNDGRFATTGERDGVPIGPQAYPDWLYMYPAGFRALLNHIKQFYRNPMIYITENGVGQPGESQSLEAALNDVTRIEYYYGHLNDLQQAIMEDGVNVKGYFLWSLLDNYEWTSGYTTRFGITYVDYDNGRKRYNKLSAKWYRNFLLV